VSLKTFKCATITGIKELENLFRENTKKLRMKEADKTKKIKI
jgi:hypothetical protein